MYGWGQSMLSKTQTLARTSQSGCGARRGAASGQITSNMQSTVSQMGLSHGRVRRKMRPSLGAKGRALRAWREEEYQAQLNLVILVKRSTTWHVKHNPGVLAQANRVGGVFSNGYGFALQGHDNSPYDVLFDVRARLIAMLDESIKNIDSTQIVESVLEENIKKVKDTKLATLLNGNGGKMPSRI